MTTYLLIEDPLTSSEMRHEVGEPVMDELIFIEHDGRRIIIGSLLEEEIFATREDVVDEFWNMHHLGAEELLTDDSFPYSQIMAEIALRALGKLEATEVIVPPSFGVLEADYLRDRGVKLVIDHEVWAARRRRKTPWELEGIERAQRAADTALLTAARMLRDAEPTSEGALRYEGEILTAEWVRDAMSTELLTQGAESEEIIVHSGEACLKGHDIGSGPILADATCIIDCFPRDRRTGVYTDMTRTFVPGRPSQEVKELHAHCRAAMEIALGSLRPGATDVHGKVVEYFHSHGYPTREHHNGDDPLREGFFHSTGHGVGLEVHEHPRLGRRSEPLVAGDVVAIEPGLYFPVIGGVRLEDTVLVTESGFEYFTDPLPHDLEP